MLYAGRVAYSLQSTVPGAGHLTRTQKLGVCGNQREEKLYVQCMSTFIGSSAVVMDYGLWITLMHLVPQLL